MLGTCSSNIYLASNPYLQKDLAKIEVYVCHKSIFFRIFAADMQISNRQINIALALVAAGLLAVCIASVMSAMN
jgi:hypothetical protein